LVIEILLTYQININDIPTNVINNASDDIESLPNVESCNYDDSKWQATHNITITRTPTTIYFEFPTKHHYTIWALKYSDPRPTRKFTMGAEYDAAFVEVVLKYS
jgi:hypothetical protein